MSTYWEDDYIDYGYSRPTYAPVKKSTGGWKSKYGGGGWSKSSWSNYSFFVEYADNNDSLFVKDPVTYITPTSVEIKKKASARKQESIDLIKELARVCYLKMIDDKDYIVEKYADFDNLSDEDKSQNIAKKELFDSIYDQFIPGFTPLEQAIAIYLKLKNSNNGESVESDEDGDENLKSSLDFDREIYFDPNINEQLELNDLSRDRKMEILNVLSLVGQFGTEFKVEKEISEKIVANSDEYSKMIMRSHDQLTMIDTYQRLLPNFDIKFLTKDLTINVPVDRKEQIQKIIIILDYSGSMSDDEKQIWVNGILIDRFKYVMEGEAEVFFSYFVDDTDDLHFQHITNKEEVIAFWQTFSNRPNGGMTEVGDMVNRIASEISNKKLMNLDIDLSEEMPEILVINDGQDDIHSEKFPYKVNAITLMDNNDGLRDLCLETRGKLIEVDENHKVFANSVEGGRIEIKK
jgi:hypothetical protein